MGNLDDPAIAPQWVGDIADLKPVAGGFSFEPAYRGWITKDRSEPGHIGDPRWATPEKGEFLFRTYAADLVAFLERVAAWDGHSWSG